MSDQSQRILIIGAGAFGLSTALHLARRGYTDVTVIDRVPFDRNHYSPDHGCDGASSDINKVFRTGYADRKVYEDLAFKAFPIWEQWNQDIKNATPGTLPPGIDATDELLTLCGVMRLGQGKELNDYHRVVMENIEKKGRRDRVFLLNNEDDFNRAESEEKAGNEMKWTKKLGCFNNLLGGKVYGILDMDTGFTRADKACVWALNLCKQLGVKFVLDESCGKFDTFIRDNNRILGVRTKSGDCFYGDKTIVACGGWTPSIVPEVSNLLETTAGSVCFVDLPADRPDLRRRFGPKEFCVWSCQLGSGEIGTNVGYRSMGGFPADPSGRLKFGFRAVKYTNFETEPVSGKILSIPRTRYSDNPLTDIPQEALDAVKNNIMQVYPELTDIGITGTKLCWYTDSIDNHFVGDYVPGTDETLFVASGGSGHGFKFLPVLGEHFVNQLEKKVDQFSELWKWRTATPGAHANGLEEGSNGPRVLSRVRMASSNDWKFA